MNVFIRILILSALISLPLPADGMMFSYEEINQEVTHQTSVTENSQRVLLLHDSAANLQKTVIEIRSDEVSGDFIWMIPIVNEDNITAEEFLSGFQEEGGCGEDFNDLSALAGPQIYYVRHEVIEHLEDYDMPFFACGMAVMEDGAGDELGDTAAQDGTLPNWSSTETKTFTVDFIKIETITEFTEWLDSRGLNEIRSAALPLVYEYQNYKNPGILILQGKNEIRGQIRTGISFTTRNTMPFFPLAVSKSGFGERMELEVYVAGTEKWKPEGNCRDFLWDVNLDAGYIRSPERYEWNSTPASSAVYEIYHTGYLYSEHSNQELYEEALEMLENNYGYYDWDDENYYSNPGWQQTFSGTAAGNSLPFSDAGFSSGMMLTAFRQSFLNSAYLEDITFERETDISFRGGLRIHVAVPSGKLADAGTSTDLSLLFPPCFPDLAGGGDFPPKKR